MRKFYNILQNRRHDLLCLSIIICAAVIFFYPVWLQGKTFYAFDTLKNLFPWLPYAPPGFKSMNALITDPLNSPYPASLLLSNIFFYNNFNSCFELPLWNSNFFGGVPFSGYYTSPVKLLFYACIPPVRAHDIFLFVHLCAAGSCCWLFLRQLRRSRIAALAGALMWMFNAYVMCWFEFEAFLLLAATLPAALLFIDRWLRRGGIINWLLLTLTLSWALMPGYAHLLMLHLLLMAAYTLFMTVPGFIRNRKRECLNRAAGVLLAVLVSFMSSLNFFLDHYETYAEGSREPYSFSGLLEHTGRVPARFLPQLIYPYFFGSPSKEFNFLPRDYQSQLYNNFSEMCIFCGIPALFLLAAALAGLKRHYRLRFFFCAGVVILLMCMGTILYYPLYLTVPGLKLTTPTRLLQLFGFCVCVCSAFGLDVMLKSRVVKYKAVLTGLWLAIAATALLLPLGAMTGTGVKLIFNNPAKLKEYTEFARHFYSFSSPDIYIPLICTGLSLLCCLCIVYSRKKIFRHFASALLILLLTTELMAFGWNYNTAVPAADAFPPTPGIDFLMNQEKPFRIMTLGPFYLNAFAPFGLENIGGYASAIPERLKKYIHFSQQFEQPGGYASRILTLRTHASPLIDLLNVKYILTPPESELQRDSNLKLVYSHEIDIYENLNALPRAFLVPEAIPCGDDLEAFDKLSAMSRKELRDKVVIESATHKLNAPPSATSPLVAIKEYSPSRIKLNTSGLTGGYLVLSNNYHPGWKCTVNGAPADILKANYIMQAIALPPGENIVIFSFSPALPVIFLWISIATYIALTALLVYFITKARNKGITNGHM